MLKKALLSLGSILLFYTFLGFVVFPFVAKSYIPKFFSQTYHLETKLEDVSFNPYTFELSLKKFKIYQDHKRKKLLSFDRFFIDLGVTKLLQKQIEISDISLQKIYLNPVFKQNEGLNFVEIFASKKTQTNSKEKSFGYDVIIDKISIKNSDIKFKYITPQFQKTFFLNDIDLNLGKYALFSQGATPFSFFAKFNQHTPVTFKGKFASQKTFQFDGKINIKDLDLKTFSNFIEQNSNIALKNGRLFLKADLQLKGKDFVVQKIDAAIDNLHVNTQKEQKNILDLHQFQLVNGFFDLQKQKFAVKRVFLQKADLDIVRYVDDSFSLEKLIKQSSTKKKKKKSSFGFKIDEFVIKDSIVNFDDQKVKQKLQLSHIDLKIKEISNDLSLQSSYLFKSKLDHATISAQGSYRVNPFTLKTSLHVKDLDLEKFSPYLQETTYIKIAKGDANFDTNITYKKDPKQADLKIQGDLFLNDMALFDTKNNTKTITADDIDLKNFKVELFPNRAYINQIDIKKFFVFAHIDSSKKFNLFELTKATKKKKSDTNKFPYAIGTILIKNSTAFFRDDSLSMPFQTNIHNLHGKVYALSNDSQEISYISLNGVVDKYGSMQLKGNFQSSDPKKFLDTKLEFRNIDLKHFSGYILEYAGYKIKNGKLLLRLHYRINKSKLHSTNSIVLKDIALQETQKADMKFPLSLALALLEDNNGEVDLEIPVSGNVDDPHFHYRKIIQKSFEDIIKKVITSPFYLVADLVGLSPKELSFVGFEYGSAQLLPSQKEKLDKLSLILKKRPHALLIPVATYDPKQDTKVLAQKQLLQKLLAQSQTNNKRQLQDLVALELIKSFYVKKYSKKSLKDLELSYKKQYQKNENVYNIELRKKLFALLVQKEQVNKKALEDLAKNRVENIVTYLLQKKVDKAQIGYLKNIMKNSSNDDLVKLRLDLHQK